MMMICSVCEASILSEHVHTGQAALQALREGPYGATHLITGDILDVCDGFMEKARKGGGEELARPWTIRWLARLLWG